MLGEQYAGGTIRWGNNTLYENLKQTSLSVNKSLLYRFTLFRVCLYRGELFCQPSYSVHGEFPVGITSTSRWQLETSKCMAG